MSSSTLNRIARALRYKHARATAPRSSRRHVDFSRYEVASFDMFDTLVERLVCDPSDVFRVVELRAAEAGIDARHFARDRQAAERLAASRYGYSATIDQIYGCFSDDFSREHDMPALEALEKRAELELCLPREEGRRLFDAALDAGVRVVIVSDMYMPGDLLGDILSKCGYSGWERLFVSCEWGCSKADGSLYRVVSEQLSCPPSKMIHIGDNIGNDVLRAKEAGLAVHVAYSPRPDVAGLAESFVAAATRRGRTVGMSDLESFGYRCLGPVLVGYCTWLAGLLERDPADKVLYLARDARVLQEGMRKLGHDVPGSTYLYVSRRSLRVPAFVLTGDAEELLSAIDLPAETTLGGLFERLGFSAGDLDASIEAAGADPGRLLKREDIAGDPEVLALLGSVRRNGTDCQEQLDLLLDYLRGSGLAGRVALADIGWTGNIQVALERLADSLDAPTIVAGYYVGVWPNSRPQCSHRMSGFLFDGGHNAGLWKRESRFHRLFETFFTAEHGTTLGYRREDGKVVPVLAEYGGQEAERGRGAAEVRRGALAFAADWRQAFGDALIPITPELAMRNLDAVLLEPSLAEAEAFGDWQLENEGQVQRAASPQSLVHYLTHPSALKADYGSAPWKPGFEKRLLGLPIGYERVLGGMRRRNVTGSVPETRRLRVLFIADIPVTGGATDCMVELIDCLHSQYGVRCTVCTAQRSDLNDRLAVSGADSVVTGHGEFLNTISRVPWKKPLSFLKRAIEWREKGHHAIEVAEGSIDFSDIDIIHSNLPRNDLGEELARRHGIPHVCHLRENSFEGFKLTSLKPHPEEYLSKNSAALVAVSESVRDNWVRRGVDPRKVRVIYDGISSAALAASAKAAAGREPDPEGCLRVAFLGGYDPVKGTRDVVEAVGALAPAVRERVRVCIYGPWRESDYGRSIETYVADHDLGGVVELHGYADDVPELLSHFDVGLACSRHEAFGRIVLDYRAAGLTVVAARAGSFPELVNDGVDGLLYDPDAAADSLAAILTRLVEDRTLIGQLTSAPYHIRTEHDVAHDVMGLYEDVLGTREEHDR